jgi:hypothetical protein
MGLFIPIGTHYHVNSALIGPDSSGGETGISGLVRNFINNSGGDLELGDVVGIDTSGDDFVTLTNTPADMSVIGVVSGNGPFTNGSAVPVLVNGYHGFVKITGAIARGDYLQASSTPGVAEAVSPPDLGAFARVIKDDSAGTAACIVFDRSLGAGSGSSSFLGTGWIDVSDPLYGAVPDDATNNTAAINDAIAAVQANGGGTLYFPYTADGGKYRHSSNLDELQTPSVQVPIRVLFDMGVQIRPSADVTTFKTDQDNSGDFADISSTVVYENVWVQPVTTGQGVAFDILDSFGVQFKSCYVKNAKVGVYIQSNSSWSEGTHGDLVIDNCTMGVEFANNGGTGSNQSTHLDLYIRTADGGTGIKVGTSCTVFGSTFNVQIWPSGNNSIAIDMQGDGNHSIWHGLVDLAGTTPTPVYALRIGSGATNLTTWQFDVKFQGTYNGGEQESGAVKNASAIAWTHRTLPYGTGTSNVDAFTDLSDAPINYAGASAGDPIVVNSTVDGLEFGTFPPPALTKYRQFVFTGDNPFTFVTDSDGQPVFALLDLE